MVDTMQQQIRSSFIPFLSTSYDRQQLKRLIQIDIDEIDDGGASMLPTHMKLLFSQTAYLLSSYENMELQDRMAKVEAQVNRFLELTEDDDDSVYAACRSRLIEGANDFLLQYFDSAQKHNLMDSIEKSKAETPYDLLKSVMDIDGYRDNAMGFPISYQQRILAEFAVQRIKKKYDFNMLVVGKRGRGKSTWTAEEVSTFLEIEGQQFGIENCVLTESREDLFNAVKGWQPGEGHIFDEAINQFFSRDFFKSGDFIQLLTEVRYKRTFSAFLVPELFQIDKIVRESLVDLVAYVTERGIAVLQAPSLVSGEERYMQETPTSPVLTPEAHTDYLLTQSYNSITTSPFRMIPDNNPYWTTYESVKDNKISHKKYTKPQRLGVRLKADEHYYRLALSIANTMPNAQAVSEKSIAVYGQQVSYNTTGVGFAKWLAKNLGMKKESLIVDRPSGMVVDISNPLVRSYLVKLKSQKVNK